MRQWEHKGESQKALFSSPPFLLPVQTHYELVSFHRILESQDLATHGDSAGRVHWRPPPPKWADGHWLPMRSAPNISLILDETSPVFLSYHGQGTWEGLTLGSVFTRKKTGHGEPGETPCLLPCATKGCFAAPNTLLCSRCTCPALGALQHPCFDSIFAQFCSFAATCAFKVLCSTNLCFAALNALKHFCTF